MKENRIKSVEVGSLAQEAGIEASDCIIAVDGNEIHDILEYRFYISEPFFTMEIEKESGERCMVDIDNPDYVDIGIDFEFPLLCRPKACANQCIFCFVDQLPRGLRSALYFKDDDVRLSFLQGNYVTMTNLNSREIESIISMRISPVNISVHSTDPALRSMMTGSKNAGNIMEIMQKYASAGIEMNCQIVLLPGINDAEALEQTLMDLTALYPRVHSISVVPVGLTKHREGLYPLEAYSREGAEKVIAQVSAWQEKMQSKHECAVVYLADEFYLLAGTALPDYTHYEEFPQIENGVGMTALFISDFAYALEEIEPEEGERHISIATGMLAKGILDDLVVMAEEKVPGLQVTVHGIENTLLGSLVTVAGLVCGADLIAQMSNANLGQELLIPSTMLRSERDLMIDGLTAEDVAEKLNIKVTVVEADGFALAEKLMKRG